MSIKKQDPQLSALPPFEHFISQIDLDAVAAAIVGDGPALAEYDVDDAKRMVWGAAEKYLVRDIYDLHILNVEKTEKIPYYAAGKAQTITQIKDVAGIVRGRLSQSARYAGQRFVIDWKTTRNTLDANWERYLRDSWQWRLYAAFDDARVVMYRGLARPKFDEKKGEYKVETRELVQEVPNDIREHVLTQVTGMFIQRDALIDAQLPVWPRRMPGACGSWGRECPRLNTDTGCLAPYACIPKGFVPSGTSFSYSSMDTFANCPERYRRGKLDEGNDEETEDSVFGSAVHRGLAELYKQAMEKFNECS